jgi:hypothetical protein
MLSGAAGLLAGFSALSLPVLGVGSTATVPFLSARLFTVVLMLGLGLLASALIRFSVLKDDRLSAARPSSPPAKLPGRESRNPH